MLLVFHHVKPFFYADVSNLKYLRGTVLEILSNADCSKGTPNLPALKGSQLCTNSIGRTTCPVRISVITEFLKWSSSILFVRRRGIVEAPSSLVTRRMDLCRQVSCPLEMPTVSLDHQLSTRALADFSTGSTPTREAHWSRKTIIIITTII